MGRSRSRRQMAAAIGNESSRVALTARRSRVGSAATRARVPKGKGFFSYEEKKKGEKLGIKIKNRNGGSEIFNFRRLDLSLSKVLAENLRIGKIDI